MKDEIVRRWLQKAHSDLRSARILLEADDPPTESACFHAQQAVEKMLKAYLTNKDVKVGKTHDISTLLELCIKLDKDFEAIDIDKIEQLTFYAVGVRYPDEFYVPTYKEAEEALNLAEKLWEFITQKLADIWQK